MYLRDIQGLKAGSPDPRVEVAMAQGHRHECVILHLQWRKQHQIWLLQCLAESSKLYSVTLKHQVVITDTTPVLGLFGCAFSLASGCMHAFRISAACLHLLHKVILRN